MTSEMRRLARVTAAIREQLCLTKRTAAAPQLPTALWDECQLLKGKIEMAQRHGLILAECRLRKSLLATVQRLKAKLDEAIRILGNEASRPAISGQDIVADLQALETEFDDVKFSTKACTVSVMTDCIVLEGIDLGRFEVVLDWRADFEDGGAFEVIAIDGNPAAGDEDTTHPHVQNRSLCVGDGRVPIRNALSEGRLFDFFVLVHQILHTYNPGSAFVSLDDWHGMQCPECGSRTDEDECVRCERCSNRTCAECSTRCTDCDYDFCSDCIRTCTGCDNDTCSSCRSACAECGDGFCGECLNDELCHLCHEKKAEETNQAVGTAPTTPFEPANAPVHSVRVG